MKNQNLRGKRRMTCYQEAPGLQNHAINSLFHHQDFSGNSSYSHFLGKNSLFWKNFENSEKVSPKKCLILGQHDPYKWLLCFIKGLYGFLGTYVQFLVNICDFGTFRVLDFQVNFFLGSGRFRPLCTTAQLHSPGPDTSHSLLPLDI